jgi:hypothetical protein
VDQVTRWLEGKIAEHSRARTDDLSAAVRLADALRALRSEGRGGQAFGLELPADLPTRAALCELALSTLLEWRPDLVAAGTAGGLGIVRELLEDVGMLEPAPPPAIVGRCIVVLEAGLVDFESGKPIIDPALFALVHGTVEASGQALRDVSCLDRVDFFDGAQLELHFDREAQALRGWLVFDAHCEPTAAEMDALVQIVEQELLYTGWGMNLGWDTPAELEPLNARIDIRPRVISHRFDRTPPR